MTNGTTYYYQVAATNALGTGPRSNEVAATPQVPPPPTPTPTPTVPAPTPARHLRGTRLRRATGSGAYGADGYALLGWESGGDLVSIPAANLVLDQGSRYRWNTNTTSVRAVENPTQSQRRATQWFHATSLRLHLTFNTAYAGVLHLYALDWDGTGRREIVYVDDGSSVRTVNLNASFNPGAWMHFPITVHPGATVSVRVDRTAGNATLSGLFLGGATTTPPSRVAGANSSSQLLFPRLSQRPSRRLSSPRSQHRSQRLSRLRSSTPVPTPSAPPWEVAPRGDWVGNYGASGYALLAWNNQTDVVSMPAANLVLDQGSRYRWNANTVDTRALENQAQTQRRAAQWFHASSLRLHLTFNTDYVGTLHLYAVDWDGIQPPPDRGGWRRPSIETVALSSSFHNGAWMHFPVSVTAGQVVTIRAGSDRRAGDLVRSLPRRSIARYFRPVSVPRRTD